MLEGAEEGPVDVHLCAECDALRFSQIGWRCHKTDRKSVLKSRERNGVEPGRRDLNEIIRNNL